MALDPARDLPTAPAPAPARPVAEVLARVAALWILAGCLLKALFGTPGDLPPAVRDLPLPLGTTFRLVLALEAFVGLLLLLRPGRAWPLGVLLLVAFGAVAGMQMAAGASSCGCFGEALHVPPWVMLALDALMLALLLGARPWRLARGGRTDALAGLLALAAAVALPLATDRETKVGEAPAQGGFTILDVKAWKGRAVKDTDLARLTDLSRAPDGVWLLYRLSCHVCSECIEELSRHETGEQREVVFVRLGEPPEDRAHPAVHALPDRPYVHTFELPDDRTYLVSAPTRLIVTGGVITDVVEGIEPRACGAP